MKISLKKSKRQEKFKVILDTSCYVSALLSDSGASAKILELIIEEDIFNFYTSDIIDELKKVLARDKFRLEKEKQEHFTHLIEETSFKVSKLDEFDAKACRDPNDDKFLSLAKQIDAEFIISLDEDLLVIKRLGTTRIVTPGDFLAILKES